MNTNNTSKMQISAAEQKQRLRASIKAKRNALEKKDYDKLSAMAQAHLLDSQEWQKASAAALYMPIGKEIDTNALLSAAWANGKKVLLPLCSKTIPGHMDLIACKSLHDMHKGAYGIMEPNIAESKEQNTGANKEQSTGSCDDKNLQSQDKCAAALYPDIIIIPGVAFDRKGCRIGMGKGYYDRLLARPEYAPCLRIGLAFDFQVVNEIQHESYDLPMHAICTEQGITWII